MSDGVAVAARKRGERRKAKTRAALIHAAQRLIAEGRTSAPILEITELADVGLGSFYNHFATKEELFDAAVESALELQGAALDLWSGPIEDPAQAFARSFRLMGRVQRALPEVSRVLLGRGTALIGAEHGLAPRARRDIVAGCSAGRFTVRDPESALLIVGGALLALAQAIHEHPSIDDARLTDQVTEDLLRMLGLSADEAAEVSQIELPEVTDLLHEALPHLTGPS
jgi:AcrR family transcriptional regulator